MDRTEELINQLPYYKNNPNIELLPFNIDIYVNGKYDDAVKQYREKYNEEYMNMKLLTIQKQLDEERQYHNKWFNLFYNSFLESMKNGNKNVRISYNMWDSDRDSKETFMIEKALVNFLHGLTIKGYQYKTWEEQTQVVDFMDGTITKCIKYIEVSL